MPVQKSRLAGSVVRWLTGVEAGSATRGTAVAPQREVGGRLMGEVDRYLVPADERNLILYFLNHLFIPHGSRERIWRFLLRNSLWCGGGAQLFPRSWMVRLPGDATSSQKRRSRDTGPSGGMERSNQSERLASAVSTLSTVLEEEGGAELLSAAHLDRATPLRWILLQDYPTSERHRLIIFLFGARDERPVAVLKIRHARAGRELASEWDALRQVAARLPAEMRASVPRALGYERFGASEVLLLAALPGRSMDFALGRRPAPETMIADHFRRAALWLARFHTATRCRDRIFEIERNLGPVQEALSARTPGWERHERAWLGDLQALRCPLSASHGDFWPRNLLIERNERPGAGASTLSGVVDWEHFSTASPPFEDLFHFALSYALNYSWTPYQRHSPEAAFRLAFLEENPLSRGVQLYFQTYCECSGFPHEAMRGLFHFFLLRRWIQTRHPSRKLETGDSDLWLELHRQLIHGDAPAFRRCDP